MAPLPRGHRRPHRPHPARAAARLRIGVLHRDDPGAGPAFHRVPLRTGAPADGFLALPGWTRGVVWLNGFCLGRYAASGPQRTLYAPAPLWREGANELVVLELHAPGARGELRGEPDLGPGGGTEAMPFEV